MSARQEQQLVARAATGDLAAFESLVREHAGRLYAVVSRMCANEADAEEATQEAFLRAWRSIGRFRGDARFFTWLYRIGVNEAKRVAERRASGAAVLETEELGVREAEIGDESPQRRAEERERRELLEAAVRRLPEIYRLPVVLRDIEGLSTREAAQAAGVKEAAFKSRLHRGRMALRADLARVLAEGADADVPG